MKLDVQLPSILPQLAARLLNSGYDSYHVALYSTKPDNVLKRVILKAAQDYLHPDGSIDMVLFNERVQVLRPTIQAHFIDGALTFVADDHPRPVQGSYLRLVQPIRTSLESQKEQVEADARTAVENCATLIALMHGEFVALERHYSAYVSLSQNQTTVQTNGRYVRQTIEHEPLNQKMACIFDVQGSSELEKNARAMPILNRAHDESDDTNKFLFMWLALEIIIGAGSARRHFALVTMQSEMLNNVINDLRRTRDALVHGGSLIQLNHKTFLSLKCIILMGMSKNAATRSRLLQYLLADLGA